jgi:hypothetical protein
LGVLESIFKDKELQEKMSDSTRRERKKQRKLFKYFNVKATDKSQIIKRPEEVKRVYNENQMSLSNFIQSNDFDASMRRIRNPRNVENNIGEFDRPPRADPNF